MEMITKYNNPEIAVRLSDSGKEQLLSSNHFIVFVFRFKSSKVRGHNPE